MNITKPKFRCVTKKAINDLVAQYNFSYSCSMQDWPIEIVDLKEIDNYFNQYDEQTDEDTKFCLMIMLIEALEDIENRTDFKKYKKLLEIRISRDFKIHEYTIFYYCCFGESLSNYWKVTPNMRELWEENNRTD